MCSAPGTKAIQMAMTTGDKAMIQAVDLYPHRVELIEQGKQKYGITGITVLILGQPKVLNWWLLKTTARSLQQVSRSREGIL